MLKKSQPSTSSGIYLTCGSNFDFTLGALDTFQWKFFSGDQRMKECVRSDCQTDEGIDDEMKALSNSNKCTLQDNIGYEEDMEKSSFSECSFDYQPLDTESENLLRELEDAIQQIWTTLYPFDSEVFEIGSEEYCFYSDDFDKFGSCEHHYDYTSTASSQVLYTPYNIYKNQLVQTDNDPVFELWFRNKYENLSVDKEMGMPLKNNHKEVKTLFIQCDFQEECFKENNQNPSKRKKSELTRRKKQIELISSSTSYAYSPQPSSHDYYYHMRDNPYTEKNTANSLENSLEKPHNDNENSSLKSEFPNAVNFPKIEVQVINFTFDQYGLNDKLAHFSERFNKKVRNNKWKQSILSRNEITENFKNLNLKEMISYDISDELLGGIVDQWNDLNVDMNASIAQNNVNINFNEEYLFKNQINYNQGKDLEYHESPKFLSTSNNMDQIFHLCHEKITSSSLRKNRRSKNIAKKPYTALKFRKEGTFLNCQNIQTKYYQKVNDFAKNLTEIRPIIISLTKNKLDLPYQKDIVNQVIDNIPCPEVAKYKTVKPSIEFKVSMKMSRTLTDLFRASKSKYDSKMFNFSSKNGTTRKLMYLGNINHRVPKHKSYSKLTFSEVSNKEDPFNISEFEFGDEAAVKIEIQDIIEHLKRLCIDKESLRKALKTYLKLRFDVSDIKIKMKIHFEAITIDNVNTIPSLKLQYEKETQLKYKLKNVVKISLSQGHINFKEMLNDKDKHLFRTISSEAKIFKTVPEVQHIFSSTFSVHLNKVDRQGEGGYNNYSKTEDNAVSKANVASEKPFLLSSIEGNKMKLDKSRKLTCLAVEPNSIYKKDEFKYQNYHVTCKSSGKLPMELGQYRMCDQYLDVKSSKHNKNNYQTIEKKHMTEKLSKNDVSTISSTRHMCNSASSHNTESRSDQDMDCSVVISPNNHIDAVIMKKDKDFGRKEQAITKAKLSDSADSINDSILNLYESLMKSISYVSHRARKSYSNKEKEKTSKSIRSLTDVAEKVVTTQKNIEIEHIRVDYGKSTSTLALSEQNVELNQTKRNNTNEITVLHETREEFFNDSMSTLALFERTDIEDHTKSRVKKTRTDENRNCIEIPEKSPKPGNKRLRYEAPENHSNNSNSVKFYNDQDQLVPHEIKEKYPNTNCSRQIFSMFLEKSPIFINNHRLCNEIREKSAKVDSENATIENYKQKSLASDETSYQLRENDSILQIYRSLDSLYYLNEDSTKNLATYDFCGMEPEDSQGNDANVLSFTSKEYVSAKDSILELYWQLSREES